MMTELVHGAATTLWRSAFTLDDRVLVIGASGWFGRTATAMLGDVSAMLVSSVDREFPIDTRTAHSRAWDWDAIRQFAPTVVIDCAFLTRDLTTAMPLEVYIDRNRALIENLLAVAALDSVAKVLTISSGAAVYPSDALNGTIEQNPYGWLKRNSEESLTELVRQRGIAGVIARAWSVSGAFVLKPHSYALADMILQAQEGSIAITAASPVYRRYVSVEDLLAVSLANAAPGAPLVIDSGGELVEMQQLAEAVIDAVNPRATITRPEVVGEANRYYAPAEPWELACATVGFTAAGLREQILTTQAGLRAQFATG